MCFEAHLLETLVRGSGPRTKGSGPIPTWQSVCLCFVIMASDEIDREEVDRLVKEMAARRKAVVVPATPVPPAVKDMMTAAQQPTEPAPAPERPKATRWSTNRLLMPSMPKGASRKTFALASAMSLNLPAMPRIGLPNWTVDQWDVLTARLFVALGLALGAAMPFWPYTIAGPWSLGLYISAVVLVIVTGIWGAKLTWDMRLSRAHTISIITVMWGFGLVAAVILKRMGLPT